MTRPEVSPEARLRWEERARALLEGVVAASATGSVESALRAALEHVCGQTGWPVGHVLVRDEDGVLTSTGLWHVDDRERYRRFVDISAMTRFPPGVGLPGRVLATGRPH